MSMGLSEVLRSQVSFHLASLLEVASAHFHSPPPPPDPGDLQLFHFLLSVVVPTPPLHISGNLYFLFEFGSPFSISLWLCLFLLLPVSFPGLHSLHSVSHLTWKL